MAECARDELVLEELRAGQVTDLVPVAALHAAESHFGGRDTFDMDGFVRTWQSVLEDGAGRVMVVRSGGDVVAGFAGVVAPDFMTGALTGTEMFFVVHPAWRGRGLGMTLFEDFESWAVGEGAEFIKTSWRHATMPEYIRDSYARRGYVPSETTYWRAVNESDS